MRICTISTAIFLAASVGFAQEARHDHPSTQPTSEESLEVPTKDTLSTTGHSIQIGDAKLDYDATAGTILLRDESGKPTADFFFVSYVKQPFNADRPIMFVFNGGPGSSAVWLHLGTAGPRCVELTPDGMPTAPPHRLKDNLNTWLAAADLVFIDPVGTGYSRPAEGHKVQEFYGVDRDLESVGNFIRLYLTRYQRWSSPKFLAGESYGTTRAAGLSQLLLEKWGIDVSGIVLISTVLNFQTIENGQGNELPYALYLPSYAAIALYHHKIQVADPARFLQEVRKYAMGDYLSALGKGGELDSSARNDVVDHLVKYTGLPAELIDKMNLRIRPEAFRKNLLADQKLMLGRYDGRMTALDLEPAEQFSLTDPSFTLYLPVYSSAINAYLRQDLNYTTDLDYEVLNDQARPWDFGHGGSDNGLGFLDVTGALRSAMVENPRLKVLVAAGYDDLATPFAAAGYTIDHLDLTDRLQDRVTQKFYDSGHMIYHNPDAQAKLKQDVTDFIESTLKQ